MFLTYRTFVYTQSYSVFSYIPLAFKNSVICGTWWPLTITCCVRLLILTSSFFLFKKSLSSSLSADRSPVILRTVVRCRLPPRL